MPFPVGRNSVRTHHPPAGLRAEPYGTLTFQVAQNLGRRLTSLREFLGEAKSSRGGDKFCKEALEKGKFWKG